MPTPAVPAPAPERVYFMPDLAREFDLTYWQVRNILDRLKIGQRYGRTRVLMSSDLDAFRAGIRPPRTSGPRSRRMLAASA